MTDIMGVNENNNQNTQTAKPDKLLRISRFYQETATEFKSATENGDISGELIARFARINYNAYQKDLISEDPFVENMGLMAAMIGQTPEDERPEAERTLETYSSLGWDLVDRKGRWGTPASMSNLKIVAS